jgi:hypothetical protein
VIAGLATQSILATKLVVPTEIPVELTRRFPSDGKVTWRVLPVSRGEQLDWYDVAGFPLARSEQPLDWTSGNIEAYDFFLDPRQRFVQSEVLL